MKRIFLWAYIFVLPVILSAQVGVGTTTPDPSSVLDITATDKGILIPKVSLGDITDTMLDGVNTAATGLLVYNTNAGTTGGSGVGFYYFNGSSWERLTTVDTDDVDWYKVGTTTAPSSINDSIYTQGNVAIGKVLADYKLDVNEVNTEALRTLNLLSDNATTLRSSPIHNEVNYSGTDSLSASYNLVLGNGNGLVIGNFNHIKNSGFGDHFGLVNNLSNGANQTAIRNSINRTLGGSISKGIENEIMGAGGGTTYGIENTLTGGTGIQFGIMTTIDGGSAYVIGNGNNMVSSANLVRGTANTVNKSGSGAAIGVSNDLQSTSDANLFGIYNKFSQNGTGLFRTGLYNEFSDDAGTQTGVYNSFFTSTGIQYGVENRMFILDDNLNIGVKTYMSGGGAGDHYGAKNEINSSTSGTQYGVQNLMSGSGDGTIYGLDNQITGVGADGLHYGIRNVISGNGSGDQTAIANSITNTGDGDHVGTFNVLMGTGSGAQFGTRNNIINIGDDIHYATYNLLSGNGNGDKYGVYNELNGNGTGDKYGVYNLLGNTSAGTHYGIYSDVTKAGSYAGYFLGNVAIGTTAANNYKLPVSRGTNGQVIQTDGAGNLGWVDTSTIGDDLGNHTATTDLDLNTTNNIINVNSITTRSQINFNKIRLWGDNNQTIGLYSAMTYGFLNDYAMTFTVLNAPNRGWIFRDTADGQADGAMSLTSDGRMTLKSHMRVDTDTFVVDATNNHVGIGTITPLTSLHVNHPTGNTNGLTLSNASSGDRWHFYVTTSDDLYLYFNGVQKGWFNDVNGMYTNFSDRRLKKDITPVTSVINNLKQLQLYSYFYKDQVANGAKSLGFMAQDVQLLFPELVSEGEDGYLGLNYAGFGVLAIKAIQEQQAEIQDLKAQLNAQQKELDEIKRLLAIH